MPPSSAPRLHDGQSWEVIRGRATTLVVSRLRSRRVARPLVWIALALAGAALILAELHYSWLQSQVLSALATRMTFRVAAGPSDAIRYTSTGPYDERLGYSRIPRFAESARPAGFEIQEQVRASRMYLAITGMGVFPMYREKTQAGLSILDRDRQPYYRFRHPEQAYGEFSEIPRLVVDALLYIENREMLDERRPHRNPAVEWRRLSHAMVDYGIHLAVPSHRAIGGSTLATQLEKMRHSSRGRTRSGGDKLRQMLSASLRAYQGGSQTLGAQQRIVRDYLNSLPLAAVPGYGEVTGLGDGLEVWYGSKFSASTRLLSIPADKLDAALRVEQARVYRQVLSLLLATRAPFHLLVLQPGVLAQQTDAYLRVLASQGVIPAELRDLALRERPPLALRRAPPVPDFVENKAVDEVRNLLFPLLGVERTYALDRLDLSVLSTIDGHAQREVTRYLRRLTGSTLPSPTFRQPRLLAQSDPRSVIYSFTLYERGQGMNLLRVQADNFNQPLNISEGTKLELGSTAKLRTLIHYLQIVEELHRGCNQPPPRGTQSALSPARDPLTAWAREYCSMARDKSLEPMLEASLDRRYSADPYEGFFTAGGMHYFHNFEPDDNGRIVTVRQAFERSVNLAFIRLMRDIERYCMARVAAGSPAQLSDEQRRRYLVRFADEEGRVFLRRFYEKHAGAAPDDVLVDILRRSHSTAGAVTAYRSVRPQATGEDMLAFLQTRLPERVPRPQLLASLFPKYGPDQFSLADRGYLAKVHPLELWLAAYLAQHPQATFEQAASASVEERRQVYAWLFQSRYRGGQDQRIRVLLEEDAFAPIRQAWRALGYPFDRLVPSYATAIGVSGDTPAALAELMGILLNDGVRLPRVAISELRFAEGTPMETALARQPAEGTRVLSPEICGVVRRELLAVVDHGTAVRARGAIATRQGKLALGGKTGTGDNRVKVFGPGGRVIEERVANRTAVFVFMIGDRYFGTVMVFVPGDAAGHYEFTSSLAVQVFKDLLPSLQPLLDR